MIFVQCPHCRRDLSLDEDRVTISGNHFRCGGCSEMLHVRFSQPEVRWVPDEDHVDPDGTASLFFSPQYTTRLQGAASQNQSSYESDLENQEVMKSPAFWRRPLKVALQLSIAAVVIATAWSVVTIYKDPLKGAQKLAQVATIPVDFFSSKDKTLVSENIEEDVLSSKMSAVRKEAPDRSPAIARVFGTVNGSKTELWSLPKPRGQVMNELKKGEKLQLLGRYEDWIWVKHEELGKGWVLSKSIQAQKAENPNQEEL